jgi:BirA family biotin operon repressor/biotin-[acetyl-CoA-carboxylase] ligase
VTRDGRDVVIVGCGLNVLAHPDLPGAGSVADALGRPVDRTELAADMFKYVDLWYRSLSERPEVLYETWVERLQTVGREVVVSDGAESWTGVAAGVEREGGLRVRQSGGAERLVLAGDVSIRNVGDFTTT